ncbi:Sulfite oxidase [Cladobotryum mycophilum]|uniref:Nitrate reductase [NADPH] n=1 Tax=Cladobotryum mycophilum TaxID=491253 RepID=A0ABR0SLJ5_9HYPO
MTLPASTHLARPLRLATRPRGPLSRRLQAPSRTPCRTFTKTSTPRQSQGASPPKPTTLRQFAPRAAALLASLGFLSFALNFSLTPHSFLDTAAASLSYPESVSEIEFDERDPRLPRFRISDVRKHDAKSGNPWVVYGDKVYDITDWIAAHPGGQVILTAAGGSIEPYWNIFTIHKNKYVQDILEQYCIGYVHKDDLVDGKPAQELIEDPFADDPQRHAALMTHTSKPRNAETPGEVISSEFLTPNELFYVRNHFWVPKMTDEEAEAHVLTIELLDGTTKEYTLRDLKTKFPKRSVTAVLQCSGNRRSHMSQDSGRKTNGLPWTAGAISNATWEGVYLADVLADAGFDRMTVLDGTSEEKHVHFAGLEAYAASIPIKKAVDPQGDVLLAYGMNGKTLPRDHGFPLRSVVPGNVAARSVKWLNHIALSDEESYSQWQRKDYKCFGPNQTKVDWDAAPSIQEMPVQSAITTVKLGDWKAGNGASSSPSPKVPARDISLSGYAISGGGREVIRVDVSADNGKNWSQAHLLPDCVAKDGSSSPCKGHGAWAWKRWQFNGTLPLDAFKDAEDNDPSDDGNTIMREGAEGAGGDASKARAKNDRNKRCTTLVVKATDEVYNTQPEHQAAIWNVRGNLATAWHRVQVCSDCSPSAIITKPREKPSAADRK